MPDEITDPAASRISAESSVLPAVVLAWLGAIISFLLLEERAGVRMLFCPSRAGCEAVLTSQHSGLLGVPLPWVGAGFYLLLLGLLLWAYGTAVVAHRARLLGVVVWLSVAGLAFSGMLMWVQFGVVRAFCVLCTASAVVVAGLVFTTMRAERRLAAAGPGGARAAAWALAFVTIAATLGLALPGIIAPEEVVAVVDGHTFTRTQMEADLAETLQPLRRSAYEREMAWVREKVDGALLAAESRKQNVTVEQLLAGRTGAARDEFLAQIAAGHRVEVLLRKPPLRDLHIDLSMAQVSGPRDARVQLVVFSDFQCAYCVKLAPVLEKIRKEFQGEVLVAFRYFPLEANPRAVPAAIAAECAAGQGAFWKYHDRLFAAAGDLSDEQLLAFALELGLDPEKFAACRDSATARQTVEASHADAVRLGIEGAPSLFLNGTLIGGYVEYDAVVRRIRKILAGK